MADELVQYDSTMGQVSLSMETVKNYLTHGTALTDQEAVLFMNLCKYQRLNPFVGEAYAIKYGNDFQMVIGYDTYKRRAEENPEYLSRASGIVVQRGNDIIKKEGCCLYPSEVLIGGWCKVIKTHNGREVAIYSEVGLNEYNKGKSNWMSKPATMIQKVAVAQALRSAFPADFSGLYTMEEMPASEHADNPADIPVSSSAMPPQEEVVMDGSQLPHTVTQEERQILFSKAYDTFGKEQGNIVLQGLLQKYHQQTTQGMSSEIYDAMMADLEGMAQAIEQPDEPIQAEVVIEETPESEGE